MFVFGPVPSRRLGLSLGVDLVSYKSCSLDCIYCESGKTTERLVSRRSFFQLEDIIGELSQALAAKPQLDYITLSGAGEPTLSQDIGKIIAHLKANYPEYKIALLTNGTLLTDPSLREELLAIDLIIPSLDAVSAEVFEMINGPHSDLDITAIIAGLVEFRRQFKQQFWVEIFVVPGMNDNIGEITKIKEVCLSKLKPQKIQLNSLDRPCGCSAVKPASMATLLSIKETLAPLVVEIVLPRKPQQSRNQLANLEEQVIQNIKETIARRPCTADDLSIALGLKLVEVNKYLRLLEDSKAIGFKEESRGRFYYLAPKPN